MTGHVVFVNSAARSMLEYPTRSRRMSYQIPGKAFDLPEAVAHCTSHKESIEAGVRYEENLPADQAGSAWSS